MTIEHDRDDYLWDRSGPVDPQIAELERLLAPYAWRAGPAAPRPRMPSAVAPARRRRYPFALAAAAAFAACMVLAGTWYRQRLHWSPDRPWPTVVVAGHASIDGSAVAKTGQLEPGATLETAAGGVARVEVARIGTVWVGPGSRLRLLETRSGRHRIQLVRGRIWARTWAPPGSFGVDTASALALDLGCEFSLSMDSAGSGRLAVQSGWVALEGGGAQVLVPAGAQVRLQAGRAPGTPYVRDARPAFIAALAELDAGGGSARGDAVDRLVAAARPQDAITLVALLTRYPALRDTQLFDYAARIFPPGVTRAALQVRGADALNPWWHALPYPRVKRWWLQWPDAFGEPSTDMPAALRRDVR